MASRRRHRPAKAKPSKAPRGAGKARQSIAATTATAVPGEAKRGNGTAEQGRAQLRLGAARHGTAQAMRDVARLMMWAGLGR